MPSDPPRTNHNTGPPSFGQPPQSGQHPHHISPAPPPTPQYPPAGHRVPLHQQHTVPHVPNSPLNTSPAQYGGAPQARPMPPLQNPQQPPTGPPQPPFYIGTYVNNEYQAQLTQPFLGGPFMYPPQPYFSVAPTAPDQTQPPLNVRPPRHMAPPVANPNPPRPPGRVSVPKSAKRIIAIVDPVTKEEIKPEKASATPISSTKPSPPSAVKIEPRASRPLSLTTDPADNATSRSQKSEETTKVSASSGSVPKSDIQERSEENVSPVSSPGDVNSEPSESIDAAGNVADRSVDLTENSSVICNVPNRDNERTSDEAGLTSESTESLEKRTAQQNKPSESSKSVDNQTDNQESSTANPAPLVELRDDKTNAVATTSVADTDLHAKDDSSSMMAGKTMKNSCPDSSNQSIASGNKASHASSDSKDHLEGESDLSASDVKEEVHSTVPDCDPSLVSSNTTIQDAAAETSATDSSQNDLSETESNLTKNEEVSVDTTEGDFSKEEDVDDIESTDTSELAAGVMAFKPGQRRVYPPAFMFSMRDSLNPKKVLEFQKSMVSINIFKTDNSGRKSNPRDGRGGRGGFALPSDPRGRAFPTPMGFGNTRGAIPMGGSNVSADSIDLSRARSQPPPEVPKAQNSVRNGDPRGTRTQMSARSDRFQGPSRSSHTPVDPFIRRPPVEKLKRSENAWQRNKEEDDDITIKIKSVRSLLNKLTLEKFDKIFQQIVDIDISSFEILIGIVKEIFEKTLFEPKFSDMYAELCRRLDQTIQPKLNEKDTGTGKKLNFRKILLNNCKDEFTRFANSNSKNEKGSEDPNLSGLEKDESSAGEKSDIEEGSNGKVVDDGDDELKALRAKQRMLANIRFIGELYLKDLLNEKIIHKHILQKLLTMAAETLEEDFLEAVCKLLSKTGAKLSTNPGAAEFINRYFDVLNRLARDKNMPARLRFMIDDLNDQRKNNWKVRREEVAAKTISEIRAEIRREEQVKEEAQIALRERRNRNQGGRIDHGRGGLGGSARVAMTMANISRTPSSGMSRTNAMLERHLNRSTSTSATSMQSVRLGPGGRGGFVGGSTPSLRPQSGGSRYSALAPDSQERGTASTGNADLRRTRTTPIRPPGGSLRKPVPKMEPEKLKRKSRSILEEFWCIGIFDEVQSCIVEEIESPNYSTFVDEVVKMSFECNKDQNLKSRNLFSDLVHKKVLPAQIFLDSFEKWCPEIPNVEMDFPIATELFAGLISSVVLANVSQDSGSHEYGLGFLKSFFDDAEEKGGPCKLIVMVCAAILDQSKGSGAENAKVRALDVYKSLNLDLAMEMIAWDNLFGPKMLSTALDRAKIPFLIPTFKLEMKYRELLERNGNSTDIYNLLTSDPKPEDKEYNIDVVRMVVRVTLDVILNQGTTEKNLEEVFKSRVVPALLKLYADGSNLSRDMQFSALCSAQLQFSRHDSKMPSTIGNQPCASAVFAVLYHSDLVEEQAFRYWKDEESVSMKIPGKEKMLVDTSKFFTWLDVAEEE